ncbi:CHAP domain-containing protein [Actinomadura kijaniata]|uniref:CHAP domain-containing protein n=1 Tax=Actinomadura kijaniata TaxID=46161 RepID=UPI003F1D27E4
MSGKHRKPSPLKIAVRTGGTLAVGAAVIGTAAATASASVPMPGKDAPRSGALAAIAAAKPAAQPAVKAAQPPQQQPQQRVQQPAQKPAQQAKPAQKPQQAKKRPTAADAIKIAESQVGIRENGAGETKFQDWYKKTERAKETVRRDGGSLDGYTDAQWCAMFVSWVGDQLGFSDQMGIDAWTVAHANWFKDRGRWGTEARPGAVVFFSWQGGKSIDDIVHVGMVIKDNGDGTVKTVEGNTGNAVQIKTRNKSQIVGYGYPDYAK